MSFFQPSYIFCSTILLRVVFFFYGLFQDAYGALPYTDIDYFVFTDAARYVFEGESPYERETYRYTPLLVWILIPTAFHNPIWFSFGKVLFAFADIIAGWLIFLLLQSSHGGAMPKEKALKFASIWLLNPMVATISTRGSSEGLLGVIVVALLWAVLSKRIVLAGVILGLAVHFKIYPFIYGISILWYLDSGSAVMNIPLFSSFTRNFFNAERLTILATSLLTFTTLNLAMYSIYGAPFLQHTYLHHLTRIDHRHNFSPYNTLLHLTSATTTTTHHPRSVPETGIRIEQLAFLPQLLLSALLIPLALSRRSLPCTWLIQTFAFVAFNKVCTSQYFLWYLVLLPFYLPHSSMLARPALGLAVAGAWVGAQALWLWYGWRLEFRGESVFVGSGSGSSSSQWRLGGLWEASLVFLAVNCWILGIMIGDVGAIGSRKSRIDQGDQGDQGKQGKQEGKGRRAHKI